MEVPLNLQLGIWACGHVLAQFKKLAIKRARSVAGSHPLIKGLYFCLQMSNE